MSVAIIAPTIEQAANVRIQAVIYGIESDVLKAEPGDIRIELSGDSMKIQEISRITGAPVIHEVRGRKRNSRDN